MGFIESYKCLEKLCGEVLNDNRCISAYIDEMTNNPGGSYLVDGWDNDLKQLKHYRWVRNKISHEPSCTEQNMCNTGDSEWLDGFHLRIINQTDPLSLYSKAAKPYPIQKSAQANKPKPSVSIHSRPTAAHKKSSKKSIGRLFSLAGILFIAAGILLVAAAVISILLNDKFPIF